MAQPIWQALISLVNLDHQALAIAKDIKNISTQISEKERELTNLSSTLKTHQEELKELRKKVGLVELRSKELDALEKKKRAQLDEIADQREYRSLQKELEVLGMERQDLDDQLINAYHQVELTEQKISDEKTLLAEKEQSINKIIEELQQQTNDLEKKKEELRSELQAKIAALPAEWVERYNRMKGRVSDPIVPLHNNSCSACFYIVVPQDIAKIKRGNLVSCRNCYRFLYYDKTEEKETSAEAQY